MKFNKTSQDYKQLNRFIKCEMSEQKISQSDIAYRLNISQSGISDRLSGKTDWSFFEILNVFEILGIKFHYGKELGNERNRNE